MTYTLDTCPDKAKHTPCPSGYLEWHAWAEKKAKTHVQEQCPTCGLWAIVKPKKRTAPAAVAGAPTAPRQTEEPG